jgi:hypothetical protein
MFSVRNRLAGLTTLLALAFVLPVRAAEADRFVPGDAEQIVVINVKQLLSSPLVKKYAAAEIEKLKGNKEYKDIQTITGLDLTKDVNTIVIANAGTDGQKAMVIVRGKFNLDKISTIAELHAKNKKDEFKIGKVGDRPLYEVIKDGQSGYFTFIDGTTMIGSTSKDYVTAAATGKTGKINKDLAAALQTVDSKQSIWIAGLVPEEAKKQLDNVQQGPVEALKKVKAVMAGLNVTDSLAAGLSMSLNDDKAAKELAEFANQAKGLIAFAAAGNEMIKPFADELLKTLQVKTANGTVSVSFKLNEDIIKKAAELIPKQ